MFVLVIMLLSFDGKIVEMPEESKVFESEKECLVVANTMSDLMLNDPRGTFFISCVSLED